MKLKEDYLNISLHLKQWYLAAGKEYASNIIKSNSAKQIKDHLMDKNWWLKCMTETSTNKTVVQKET